MNNRTVVVFRGEMGAGKTTLIREIVAALGSTDTVTSPTFAIVNQYRGTNDRPIYHFDFYRIEDVREAYDFGYEEYFYSGELCLVEWPRKSNRYYQKRSSRCASPSTTKRPGRSKSNDRRRRKRESGKIVTFANRFTRSTMKKH